MNLHQYIFLTAYHFLQDNFFIRLENSLKVITFRFVGSHTEKFFLEKKKVTNQYASFRRKLLLNYLKNNRKYQNNSKLYFSILCVNFNFSFFWNFSYNFNITFSTSSSIQPYKTHLIINLQFISYMPLYYTFAISLTLSMNLYKFYCTCVCDLYLCFQVLQMRTVITYYRD